MPETTAPAPHSVRVEGGGGVSSGSSAVVWLRQDLRLADNPALAYACEHYDRVLPVYIWDPAGEGAWPPGGAARWWLHHSLAALDRRLRQRRRRLLYIAGDSADRLQELIDATGATGVFWNRRYEPAVRQRDSRIKTRLRDLGGVECRSFNAALWWEPWEVSTGQGAPYRVFTPFWKRLLAQWRAPAPVATPRVPPPPAAAPPGQTLESLELLPWVDWDAEFPEHWRPGENGATQRLEAFVETVEDYPHSRDQAAVDGTSGLSPHLHFGEISPPQVMAALGIDQQPPAAGGALDLARELAWREFSWHLLYHYPHLPEQPLQDKYRRFPWRRRYAADLSAWQAGRTGIPMVDAGMRQLWRSGWMHNRVRMVVASFLTKNLLIPWQEGARWFWDTLVDADLGNNTQGWQWSAGCGADAAPYFRIFNPVRQGERFDPAGDYVRHWVQELADIPDQYIHAPWQAPASVQRDAGAVIGEDYPEPIVDLKASRERALQAYQKIRGL